MTATATIDAGVCGFRTVARAECDEGDIVTLSIDSDCPRIREYAAALQAPGGVSVLEELSPEGASRVLVHPGPCCPGCVAPAGVFKAMQVAAGLALPKDAAITVEAG